MDAVFRKSALYRPEKWDREDYRSHTIERTIAGCDRWKAKSKKKSQRPDFVLVDSKYRQSVRASVRQYVSAPLLAKNGRVNSRLYSGP